MLTTINVSLPKKMVEDAKKALKKKGYASVSEFIRDALRARLYPDVTENGFTREFEDAVLRAEKEPIENDVTWDGKTPFTEFLLKHRKKS